MSEYAVTLARSARKELERLPSATINRIIDRLEKLASNPRPAQSLKLQGNNLLWRLRVGDYRVIYRIDDAQRTIDVSAIRHRREVYRDL